MESTSRQDAKSSISFKEQAIYMRMQGGVTCFASYKTTPTCSQDLMRTDGPIAARPEVAYSREWLALLLLPRCKRSFVTETQQRLQRKVCYVSATQSSICHKLGCRAKALLLQITSLMRCQRVRSMLNRRPPCNVLIPLLLFEVPRRRGSS